MCDYRQEFCSRLLGSGLQWLVSALLQTNNRCNN